MNEKTEPSASHTSQEEQQPLSLGRLFRFFLPIGITSPIIGSTHMLVNAALARMANPELNLALFTLMKGLTNSIKAPTMAVRQLTVALLEGRRSYRKIRTFCTWLAVGLFALLAIPAYTPLLRHVLSVLYGVSDPTRVELASLALRIMCFLPIVETLRNSAQGLIIRADRPTIIPVGTVARLLLLAVFLLWVISSRAVRGVTAASLGWTVGIGIEALIMLTYLAIRFRVPSAAASRVVSRREDRLSMPSVLSFFVPLAVMIVLKALVQPVVQGGIARSADPTRYLAAYGLAYHLIIIANGPVMALHQCPLNFVKGLDDPDWPVVRLFCLLVGAVLSALVFLSAVTPLAPWFFLEVIAAPPRIVPATVEILLALSPFPIIWAWREAYWGVLMLRRTTKIIGLAKATNLAVVVTGAVVAFGPMLGVLERGDLNPGVIAAISIVVGELAESVVIWRATKAG